MRSPMFPIVLLAAVGACGRADVTGTAAAPVPPRSAPLAPPLCVHFNVPGLGTVFGTPVATPPGSVVWVENGIRVSAEKFMLIGGGTAYDWMQIVAVPAPFTLAAGQVGRLSTIDAGFDFTGLSFTPTAVQLYFYDQGGYENLAVNGSATFTGPITAPPSPLGGVNVAVASGPVFGGVQGTVRFSGGPITRVVVGGQELYIDTVCAYP